MPYANSRELPMGNEHQPGERNSVPDTADMARHAVAGSPDPGGSADPALADDFATRHSEHQTSTLTGYVQKFQDYVANSGPKILSEVAIAVLIAYVGQWGAKLVYQFLLGALRRGGLDETLTKFGARLAQAAVLIFTANAALPHLGVKTDSLVAAIAAAGLAVGLALQGSLSNFAAGVMLVLFRHFNVGDFVEAAGTKGIIEEIHIFHTVMRTPDNVRIIVPNGSITAGNISNFSAEPVRRIDLVVNCSYSDDLLAVKQFLQETVLNDARVRDEPVPVVAVDELAEKDVRFVVRPWVASEDYWDTRWDMVEAIKLGFDIHGFRSTASAAAPPAPQVDRVVLEEPTATIPLSRPTPAPPSGLVSPRRTAA